MCLFHFHYSVDSAMLRENSFGKKSPYQYNIKARTEMWLLLLLLYVEKKKHDVVYKLQSGGVGWQWKIKGKKIPFVLCVTIPLLLHSFRLFQHRHFLFYYFNALFVFNFVIIVLCIFHMTIFMIFLSKPPLTFFFFFFSLF